MAVSGCSTQLPSNGARTGVNDLYFVSDSLNDDRGHKLDQCGGSPVGRPALAEASGQQAPAFNRTIPYLLFVFVGANSLVNWTFVIQTLPFIAKSFLDGADWNNTVLGSFQAVEVLVQVLLVRFGSTSASVVVVAGLINAVAGLLIPALTLYPSNEVTRVWMLHLLCLVLGVCSGIYQGSALAIASILPDDFVSSVSTGQGLAGFFGFAVVTGTSFTVFDIDTRQGTEGLVWLVFSLSAAISVACSLAFLAAMRQPWAAASLARVKAEKAAARVERHRSPSGHWLRITVPFRRRSDQMEAEGKNVVYHCEAPSCEPPTIRMDQDKETHKTPECRPCGQSDGFAVHVSPKERHSELHGPNTDAEGSGPRVDEAWTSVPCGPTISDDSKAGDRDDGDKKPEVPGSLSVARGGKGPTENTEVQAARTHTGPGRSWVQVFRDALPWLSLVVLHMFISFHLFPKVGPLSWHYADPPKNYLVILFGIFCVFELLGRFLPDVRLFKRTAKEASVKEGRGPRDGWFFLSRRVFVITEFARILFFVPFLLGHILSNVPFINSFYWYCILIALLSLTQGWLATLAFFYAVNSVSSAAEREVTGPMTAIASPLGCVIGLYSAVPYRASA
ncbi:nucleoside transporter protein [Cystoisospora suis]|uniref:Nucleoside transporter protein n=1 Tax=Cystoisospora suis TaxID=483139 RepID=A0A2C6KZA6_9APIC|nr:nucleoside transporter protein [Cystoisospora suis]